jgi:hypothetical protein
MPTETGAQWIRALFRPGVLERGLQLLAREIDNPIVNPRRQKDADQIADADILALAERCEAAGKRFDVVSGAYFDVVSGAYDVAEFAEPHDQAAEDEAYRLQGFALDEFRDAALPLVWARATAVAGLLAKARAAKFALPEDGQIVTMIEEALRDEGVFEPAATIYSLYRDLVAIAWKTEAASA